MSGDPERMTRTIRAEAERHQPKFSGLYCDMHENTPFFCRLCQTPWPCRALRMLAQIETGEVPRWKKLALLMEEVPQDERVEPR